MLLVGPASPASVERATAMAKRLGVVLILEVRSHGASEAWCRAAQQAGVDGFAVTANIDVGMHGPYPLQFASRLRRWTELPIAVSGGFSESDFSEMDQAVCDIAIVGRSVVDAIDPEAAARRICSLRKRTEGSRSA